MKVVINKCFGGFGLSHEGIMRYAELSNTNIIAVDAEKDDYVRKHYYLNEVSNDSYWASMDLLRNCPYLVQTVEELGNASFGDYAELKVVDVPDDVDWEIGEYDGTEWVAEKHRTWS